MSFSGSVSSETDFKLTKSAGFPSAFTAAIKDLVKVSFTDGTIADRADRVYYKQLSLAGANTDLDLQSLTDIFGDALSFTEIVYGRIRTLSTADPLTIGHASSLTDAWTSWLSNPGTMTLRPKTAGFSSYVEFGNGFDPGYAVGPTNKLLRLNPGAQTFPVVVLLVGRSA